MRRQARPAGRSLRLRNTPAAAAKKKVHANLLRSTNITCLENPHTPVSDPFRPATPQVSLSQHVKNRTPATALLAARATGTTMAAANCSNDRGTQRLCDNSCAPGRPVTSPAAGTTTTTTTTIRNSRNQGMQTRLCCHANVIRSPCTPRFGWFAKEPASAVGTQK